MEVAFAGLGMVLRSLEALRFMAACDMAREKGMAPLIIIVFGWFGLGGSHLWVQHY